MTETARFTKLLILSEDDKLHIGKMLFFRVLPCDKQTLNGLFVDNYSEETKKFAKDNFCVYWSKTPKEVIAIRIYNAIYALDTRDLVMRSGVLYDYHTGKEFEKHFYIKHEINQKEKYGKKCGCIKPNFYLGTANSRDLYMKEYDIDNIKRIPFWVCIGCGGYEYAT